MFNSNSLYRKKRLLYCFLTLLSFLLIQSVGCKKENPVDPLTPDERAWLSENNGKIIIDQSSETWAPIEDFDEDGNATGIAVDYYKLIEHKLGFRFKIDKPQPWEEKIKRLKAKKIDVINNLQKTPERSEYLLFTRPFIEIPNVIILRKERKGPLTLEQMKGMKVAVTKGFAIYEYLQNKHPYINIVPLPYDLISLQEVSLKRVDAAIVNLAIASHFIEKEGITNLRIAGETDYKNSLCLASRKDWPILNRILEKGLSQITPEERKVIYKKWISLEIRPFYKNPIFQVIILAFVLLIVFGISWSIRLKKEINKRKLVEADLLKSENHFRDLTESLKESEKRLMSFYNAAFEGIAITEKGKIIDYNRQFAAILGYENDELAGMEVMELVPEEDQGLVVRNIQSGYDKPYEHRALKKDGSIIYVEVHGQQIQFEGRQARVTAIHDLTAKRIAEMALQDSERNMASVLNNTQDGVVRIDKNFRHIFANPALYAITGLSPEQYLGKTNEEIGMPEELCSFWRKKHENVFQNRKTEIFEFNYHTVNKGERVFQAVVTPEFDENNEVETIISFMRDITEIKNAESEKNDVIAKLEQALVEIKTLRGFIPICAKCKKIRDDDGYWQLIEKYIQDRSDAQFSHSICPECAKMLYSGFNID